MLPIKIEHKMQKTCANSKNISQIQIISKDHHYQHKIIGKMISSYDHEINEIKKNNYTNDSP